MLGKPKKTNDFKKIKRYPYLFIRNVALQLLFIALTVSASSVNATIYNTDPGGPVNGAYWLGLDCTDVPVILPGDSSDTIIIKGSSGNCVASPSEEVVCSPNNISTISEVFFKYEYTAYWTDYPDWEMGWFEKVDFFPVLTGPRNYPYDCSNYSVEYVIFYKKQPNYCPYDGAIQSCYDGPAGTEGVGICRSGTQTCIDNHWGSCLNERLPQTELCDGLDNDCNGADDNGFECALGQTRSCYQGLPGTEGVSLCHGGTQACNSCQWDIVCQGQVLPGVEMCDGKDNNCNGNDDCQCDDSGQGTTLW